MNQRGILIVVSGFSGAGKGTLMKELMKRYEETYALSVSATTRNPREGEVDGREYFFKTTEEFEKMIAKEELIEYARYVENYYGTPRTYEIFAAVETRVLYEDADGDLGSNRSGGQFFLFKKQPCNKMLQGCFFEINIPLFMHL